MSFVSIKSLPNTIGFRLSVGITLLHVLFSVVVFVTVYTVLHEFLMAKDHALIQAKMREYAEVVEHRGPSGLKAIDENTQLHEESQAFLIRLSHGTVLEYFHAPNDIKKYDLSSIEAKLAARISEASWQTLPSRSDEDKIEFLSQKLADGVVLQVGKSTDERDDILELVFGIFAAALLIVAVLGTFVSRWYSDRVLTPVRSLILAIRTFEDSDFTARAAETDSGDEIDSLAKLFNQMSSRIQRLIQGMQQSLDNLAHDLRTPLTRLRAKNELVLSRPGDAASFRNALSENLEAVDEMKTLLDSLMDISEAEAGAMKLRLSTFAVEELVNEVKNLYEEFADERQVRLSSTVPEQLRLSGDRGRIKRVLANLVDNAVKYNRPGGHVQIRGAIENDAVVFSVEDDGPGIPQDQHGRIWERLYRGDQSRSQHGLGLGLTLVRSIALAHGAEIELKSREGAGAVFSVRFPRGQREILGSPQS